MTRTPDTAREWIAGALSAEGPGLSVSVQVAQALASGQPVRASDAERFGVSRSTVGMVLQDFRRADWAITHDREGGQEGTYRVTHQPDGTPVAPTEATWLEGLPSRAATVLEQKRAKDAARKRARRAKGEIAERSNFATLNEQRKADFQELEQLRALLAPPVDAPPLGTTVRVVMVAEDNGHAGMALRGKDGSTWFVRIEGQPHE